MRTAVVPLDPASGAHFVGSDGVLELTAPAGAVTAADGQLSLLVRQVLPASGSNAGGSGHVTFGTWLVQVVDGSGRPAARGLRQPLAVQLHVGARAGALNLGQVRVQVNQPLPFWVNLDPGSVPGVRPASSARQAAPASGAPPKPGLGPASRRTATLDASGSTLSASLPMAGPNTAVSFDTDAPVATFGRPDPFETDLAAGALSAGIKLDLPAGPGGLTPPLQLAYNSSSVNDQHNPSAAAPWVGEGWNLGLGSISWAEHQVDMTGCQQCTTVQWEDSWQLSDPFGTAAELVPPDVNVATYKEDSGNPITPSPVTWHTAPETRAKVISFQSGIVLPNNSPLPPCFRVFLTSGIMEEFGCTPDALVWYPQPSGTNTGQPYIASWLLDLITDPEGNQVHITYQQDVATAPTGLQYTRDAVPLTVEYDSPGCKNAQTSCTGSAWTPLMRVSLGASHSVAHQLGLTCSGGGSPRCDDPVDLAGSGGVAAPLIQSTFVLNDAAVQVRASGSGTWSTLRDYRFSYEQATPTTITDPVSGTQESTAGRLLLLGLQVIGADGTTSLPARAFGYTPVTQYYEDVNKSPLPANNCGPSWNNGVKPNITLGCVRWSQTYAGNSYYLSSVNNGLGLQETFTWQQARNNFYGMVSGSSPADPFACNNASVQSTFPCNMPDNQTWSRAVLTKREDVTNGVDSVWNYGYQVQYPLPAQECSGCVASFYWGNQNDFDDLDFYNNKFMGFAQASVANPDGSVATHKFLTTQGFGIYDTGQLICDTPAPCHNDSYALLGNAAHSHEYELDQYDTNGTTLLSQVKTQWTATCPPAGVSGTPANPNWGNWNGGLVTELDHSNPLMVCEVHPFQVDRYTFDGTGGLPVHSATSYTYDGLGRVVDKAQLANATAGDTSGPGSHAGLTGGVTEPAGGLVPGNADSAMAFDGSTGFVQLPSGPFGAYPANGSSTTSYALSFEAWFQTSNGGVILGQVSGSPLPPAVPNAGGWIPAIYVDTSGVLRESLFWHGGSPMNVASGTYTDSLSHHVVATYANGVDSLYVDGQLKASQASVSEVGYSIAGYSYELGSGYAGTYPGVPSGSGWYPFKGTIGEAAVYPAALSAARVQAHFSAGAGYQAAVAADSPSAYWRLNDQAGTTSPNTIVNGRGYVQNDGVSVSASGASGPYLINYPAFDDLEDPSGNHYQCAFSSYDGQPYHTSQFSGLTVGKVTTADRYTTTCGSSPSTSAGPLRTTSAYDVFGNLVGTADPDANAGNTTHLGCTAAGATYSSCTTYDGTFNSLPTSSANALNQTSATGYQSPTATAPAVVQDGSGHGYNATPGSAVGFGAVGLVSGDPDTAMSFNGTSASTVGLDLPSVDTTSGGRVTVELWMKWPGGMSGGMPFGFNRYDLWMNPSVGFGFNTAAGDVYGVAASAIPANTPVHVVAVFTNGSVTSNQLYINGVAQSLTQRGTGTPTSQTATQFANVSGWGRDTGNRWTGSVGKVAIYNGTLSATQVQAHFTAGAGYNAAVLGDSPIAYYRLNDTAATGGFGLWPTSTTDANGKTTGVTYDALGRQTSQTQPVTTIADGSGHARSGVPNGSMVYGAPGMTYGGDADTAMSFTGGTVNLNLPTLDTTAGHQVTVEFWMQYSGGGGMPFGFNQYDLWLDPSSGFGFNTAVGDSYGAPLSSVPTNAPLHVVAVFTNGSLTSNVLYINGVAQTLGQLRGTPTSRSVTANANIAGWGQDGNNRFPGTIDEVAVYNGALSAARVQAHFNAGTGYKSAVLADSPLAYYRLDEDSRPATQTTTYTVWCTGSGPQTPCIEVDRTQRLNSSTTATARAFYDGLGHLIETRSPAPGGQDVVRYSVYDASQRIAFQSVPYLVTAYTGAPGAAAFSVPDSTQHGTIYDGTTNGITYGKYDGLGRLLVSTDALLHTSTRTYTVVCAPTGTDAGCYEQTLTVDPNAHQSGTLVDGLGRTAYVQRYTGSGPSYSLYATARYTYDFVGNLVKILQPT